MTDDDLTTTEDVASDSYQLAVVPEKILIRCPYHLPVYKGKRKKEVRRND